MPMALLGNLLISGCQSKSQRMSCVLLEFPLGASQWNPIEHNVFSPIRIHWRGKPRDAFTAVVQYSAHTTKLRAASR
jgi:hypothetical protein